MTALVSGGKDALLLEKAARALQIMQKKFPEAVLIFTALENGVAKVKLRFSPDRPGELQWWSNRHFPPYLSVTALALQAANPEQSALIEEQYPFEEYGEAIWGNEEIFQEELAKILHRGYCWKQKSQQISAAFILPEGFVLGVSIVKDKNTAEPTKLLEELSLAVKDFKSHVWQSNGV